MTHRRISTHQEPRGTVVSLTPRDADILAALRRYRYLRAPYLHAFAGGRSEKRFIERLGLLFHEGYLDRPDGQWKLPDARRRPALYEIGTHGGNGDEEARTFLGSEVHGQLEHASMICAVLASFEIACGEAGTPRFIPWLEILARAPADTRGTSQPFKLRTPTGETLIPDGIFGLEYANGEDRSYRFFALEADRGTMPISRAGAGQTSLMEKFRRYEAFVASDGPRRQLGVSSFIILTVTTSEARGGEIVRRAAENLSQPGRFLCAAVSERTLDSPYRDLLSGPWVRASFAPVPLASGASA